MFRKLFSILKRKKPTDNSGGQIPGQATTSVPGTGVAVGAGVGASQPGQSVNPGSSGPVASADDTPQIASAPTGPPAPLSDITAPSDTNAVAQGPPTNNEPVAPGTPPEAPEPVEAPSQPPAEPPVEPMPGGAGDDQTTGVA